MKYCTAGKEIKAENLSLQGASLSGTDSPDGLKVKLQSTN